MSRFVCCGITFDGEQGYIDHLRLIHGEQPQVVSSCCGIHFYTDEGYQDHRKRVHGSAKPEDLDAASPVSTTVAVGPGATSWADVVYLSRCKVCRTPIRGLKALPYRLRGVAPFSKNPQLCNRCSKARFPAVEQEITVMFADVRGFTSMSERFPLQRLREHLNVMFAAASRILIHNDALVDKFLGDAVMALFNAPIPQPRHREVAIRTAVALQEEIARLKLPFAIGIGLNTGIAITGNVGGGEVTDYTAIGDTVNVASRLSGQAQKGEILMGASTVGGETSLIPPGYGWGPVSLQVKGREQPVEAYRVYPLRSPIAS